MASTQIVSCKCKNEFQDKKYGQGKRVHNLAKGKTTKFAPSVVRSAETKRTRCLIS